VVHGVSRGIMGLSDSVPLIDRIGDTAREILVAARESGRLASEIARERAAERIRRARSLLSPR